MVRGRRRLLAGLAGTVLAGSARAAAPGRVEDQRVASPALGRPLACTIYRPAVAAGLDLPPVHLAVGDDDALHLERGAIALYNTLRAEGRAVELRIADGGHDWAFWSEAAPDMLRFLGRHLTIGDPP